MKMKVGTPTAFEARVLFAMRERKRHRSSARWPTELRGDEDAARLRLRLKSLLCADLETFTRAGRRFVEDYLFVVVLGRLPLTPHEHREISRACACDPKARVNDACTKRIMRCNGSVRVWIRLVDKKRRALFAADEAAR